MYIYVSTKPKEFLSAHHHAFIQLTNHPTNQPTHHIHRWLLAVCKVNTQKYDDTFLCCNFSLVILFFYRQYLLLVYLDLFHFIAAVVVFIVVAFLILIFVQVSLSNVLKFLFLVFRTTNFIQPEEERTCTFLWTFLAIIVVCFHMHAYIHKNVCVYMYV